MTLTPRYAQETDLFQSKRGAALLAACIVQTASEADPSFQERFLARLSALYNLLRDNEDGRWEGDVAQEMELLAWTREYLTGLDRMKGQGKPLMSDYKPK